MRNLLLVLLLLVCIPFIVHSQNDSSNRGEFRSLESALESPLKVRVLRLDDQNIKTLPIEILMLKKLKRLTLQYNRNLDLVDLFSKLSKLPNLVDLDLSNCDIQNLPPQIGDLKNLRKLEIGMNKFKCLPNEISRLKKLDTLIFSQYPDDFRSFPREEKIKFINLLPKTDILLIDYFGGVHGNFRLGKEVVKVTMDNLY